MLKKNAPAPTFAEAAMESRLDAGEPLLKLREAVDWGPLERKLKNLYVEGVGRPAYPPLALFRRMRRETVPVEAPLGAPLRALWLCFCAHPRTPPAASSSFVIRFRLCASAER